MPAVRTRSSKRGTRGDPPVDDSAAHPSQTVSISFAPTVTPGTFLDPPTPIEPPTDSMLFPPSPDAPDTSRRSTHTKKKPENHIPRPPNAFILFRSSFIKNQHVSSDVETNHSTLSKIIGLTWQNLPHDEKQIWHAKAKVALEEHKKKFPQYTFKPAHPKAKAAEKRKVREVGPKDQIRCAKIAELLVEGLKGAELETAIAEFDRHHIPTIVTRFEAPITARTYRRSSSAPVEETEHSKPTFLVALPQDRKPRASSTQPEPSTSREPSSPLTSPSSPLSWNAETDTDTSSEYSYEQLSVPTSPSEESVSFTLPETTYDFGSFSFAPSTSPALQTSLDPLSAPSGDMFDMYSAFTQPIIPAEIHSPSSEDVFGPSLTIDTSVYGSYSSSPSPTSSIPSTPPASQNVCSPIYGSDPGFATDITSFSSSYGYFPDASTYSDTLSGGFSEGNGRADCYPPSKPDFTYYDKSGMMCFPDGLNPPQFLSSYAI